MLPEHVRKSGVEPSLISNLEYKFVVRGKVRSNRRHVPEAIKIIRAEKDCFELLRKTLRLQWVVGSANSEFDPDQSESLVLLSSSELEKIWAGSK